LTVDAQNQTGDIQASMPVGVVLERRTLDNPWQDHDWRAVAVLPGAARRDESVEIGRGEGWIRFHAATLEVELFRKETEGYRLNLSNDPPLLYIVLRAGEEAGEPEIMAFLATACPYEAQDYQDSGEEIVDGVPMPVELIAWIQDFIDRHHVDEPFVKRKRKSKNPHKVGTEHRPPVLRGRGHV
jgi:hypothetical protein